MPESEYPSLSGWAKLNRRTGPPSNTEISVYCGFPREGEHDSGLSRKSVRLPRNPHAVLAGVKITVGSVGTAAEYTALRLQLRGDRYFRFTSAGHQSDAAPERGLLRCAQCRQPLLNLLLLMLGSRQRASRAGQDRVIRLSAILSPAIRRALPDPSRSGSWTIRGGELSAESQKTTIAEALSIIRPTHEQR